MDAVQTWVFCGKTEGWREGEGREAGRKGSGVGSLIRRGSSGASGVRVLHTLTCLELPTDREAEHCFLIEKSPGTQPPLILFFVCGFLPSPYTKKESGAHCQVSYVHQGGE